MTDQILEDVRESVFKKYKSLHETIRQNVKIHARSRTQKALNDLMDRIDDAIMSAEREQSLLILSIDEDDGEYDYVKVITESISMVGEIFIPLQNLIDKLDENE